MSKIKIGDKFQLPVFYECDPLSEVAKFSAWQGNGEICKSLFLAFDDCDADLICEAINNHDRMVEEIAELRHELANLICAAENNTGNEPSISCFNLALDEAKGALKNKQVGKPVTSDNEWNGGDECISSKGDLCVWVGLSPLNNCDSVLMHKYSGFLFHHQTDQLKKLNQEGEE